MQRIRSTANVHNQNNNHNQAGGGSGGSRNGASASGSGGGGGGGHGNNGDRLPATPVGAGGLFASLPLARAASGVGSLVSMSLMGLGPGGLVPARTPSPSSGGGGGGTGNGNSGGGGGGGGSGGNDPASSPSPAPDEAVVVTATAPRYSPSLPSFTAGASYPSSSGHGAQGSMSPKGGGGGGCGAAGPWRPGLSSSPSSAAAAFGGAAGGGSPAPASAPPPPAVQRSASASAALAYYHKQHQAAVAEQQQRDYDKYEGGKKGPVAFLFGGGGMGGGGVGGGRSGGGGMRSGNSRSSLLRSQLHRSSLNFERVASQVWAGGGSLLQSLGSGGFRTGGGGGGAGGCGGGGSSARHLNGNGNGNGNSAAPAAIGLSRVPSSGSLAGSSRRQRGWATRAALALLLALLLLVAVLGAWGPSGVRRRRGGGGDGGGLFGGLLGGATGAGLPAAFGPGEPGYLVIIDAGSTGSRVHVFRSEGRGGSGSGEERAGGAAVAAAARAAAASSSQKAARPRSRGRALFSSPAPPTAYARLSLPEPKLKVTPGLSAHASDPAAAAASLAPLLEFAAQHVPEGARARTPVRLMATAGLRLVPRPQREAVLRACLGALAASGFHAPPGAAEVISGAREGLYGWVAVNYATGALQRAASLAMGLAAGGGEEQEAEAEAAVAAAATVAAAVVADVEEDDLDGAPAFFGLIELGGASAQLTLLPDEEQHAAAVPSWSRRSSGAGARRAAKGLAGRLLHRLGLPGLRHREHFTHSYLGFGFDVVEARVKLRVLEMARTQRAEAGGGGGRVAGAPAAPAPNDPCLPRNYKASDGRVGTGDLDHCRRLVLEALFPPGCARRRQQPDSDSGGNGGGGRRLAATRAAGDSGGPAPLPPAAASAVGAPLPEVPCGEPLPLLPPWASPADGAAALAATENFYYVARALALPETSSPAELLSAASAFCSRDWRATARLAPSDPASLAQRPFLWRYCFGGALAHALLGDVLRLPPGTPLTFANAVRRKGGGATGGEEVGLDWALGAAVLELSGLADAEAASARAAAARALGQPGPSGGGGGGRGGSPRRVVVVFGAFFAMTLVVWRRLVGGPGGGGGSARPPPLAGMA